MEGQSELRMEPCFWGGKLVSPRVLLGRGPPPPPKQSINRAKLMAVIISVRHTHTHTHNQLFAVAMDSSYVYGSVRGSSGERNNGSPAKAL